MPEPWDHKRVALLTEMLLELLDAADLDDNDADTVCNVLVPALLQRSGLDPLTYHAAASVALYPDRVPAPMRRH